jgi:hypothetical protein
MVVYSSTYNSAMNSPSGARTVVDLQRGEQDGGRASCVTLATVSLDS